MPQLKKLLFNHEVSDIEGDVWKFSFGKAAIIFAAFFVVSIIFYGYIFAEDSKRFFGDVIFYATVFFAAIFILMVIARSLKKARSFISKFFLLIIGIIGSYAIIGFIWNYYFWEFHMGYSTWFMFVILAGYGATREYIFNGVVDRHDAFYCLLLFFIFISANVPIIEGDGFLARIDGLVGIAQNLLSGAAMGSL